MDESTFCRKECIDKGHTYCSPEDFKSEGECYKSSNSIKVNKKVCSSAVGSDHTLKYFSCPNINKCQ